MPPRPMPPPGIPSPHVPLFPPVPEPWSPYPEFRATVTLTDFDQAESFNIWYTSSLVHCDGSSFSQEDAAIATPTLATDAKTIPCMNLVDLHIANNFRRSFVL